MVPFFCVFAKRLDESPSFFHKLITLSKRFVEIAEKKLPMFLETMTRFERERGAFRIRSYKQWNILKHPSRLKRAVQLLPSSGLSPRARDKMKATPDFRLLRRECRYASFCLPLLSPLERFVV